MSTQASRAASAGTEADAVFLDRLSDEELVLLDAEHPLVRLPHHEGLGDAERAHAVVGAMRGLRARGHETDQDRRTIALPQHLGDLLDLRTSAPCVLMIQTLLADPAAHHHGTVCQHYGFVVDGFVLLEDVSQDGLHDFWAVDLSQLAAEIQARVPVATGAQDGAGRPVEVDLMAVAAGESQVSVDCVGRPLAQVDSTVWRAPATPEPPLQAIVLGDRGSYVSVATVGAQGPVTLTPIAVSGVGEQVVSLLAPGTMNR